MKRLLVMVASGSLLALHALPAAASCAGDALDSRVSCEFTGPRDVARVQQCEAIYQTALAACQRPQPPPVQLVPSR